MPISPRDLSFKDRFVWELEQAVTERFEDFDNLIDRFIFPDLTTQVKFVLSLNQTEWTALYGAVLTGADLSYPNEAHNVEYLFLQTMESGMADLCSAIADCIANSTATRDALNQFLEDSGYGAGGGDGSSPHVYDENELLIDGVLFGSCDNDELFGAITQSVDLFNQIILDGYEAFEASTAPWERISAILEAIPITNVLAVDDLIQFADQALENLAQNYTAEYTAALRDEYRCDLFCLIKDTCEMSFRTMADYFMGRVGESFEGGNFLDMIDWFVFGSFTDEAVVHASHALLCNVLAYGSRFFNVDNSWLAKAMTSFLNDPDSDWTTLCTSCPATSWEWVYADDVCVYGLPAGYTLDIDSGQCGDGPGSFDGLYDYQSTELATLIVRITPDTDTVVNMRLRAGGNTTAYTLRDIRVEQGAYDVLQDLGAGFIDYHFPTGETGEITITLRMEGGNFNGVGIIEIEIAT